MSQSPFANPTNASTLSTDICSRLPWPICTIDFEASSLDRAYPVNADIHYI